MGNLKPFQRGHDPRRNLKGRPKSLPPLDALLLDVLGEGDGRPMKKIIQVITARALRGDLRCAEFLVERVYGKVKTLQEHSGSIDMMGLGLSPDELKEFSEVFRDFKARTNGTGTE
jgi:hypothetical protein